MFLLLKICVCVCVCVVVVDKSNDALARAWPVSAAESGAWS